MTALLAGCSFSPLATDGLSGDQPSGQPLYTTVSLGSEQISESGQKPDYTLSAQIPQLGGSTDGRVMSFNSQMITLVYEDMDLFKQNLALLPAEPITGGSFLEITWEQMSPPGDLLSLKFNIAYYTDGAAHPGTYSRTATYDLENGGLLALENLFLPQADYLSPIASYCLAQLKAGDIGDALFEEGADPLAENYSRWNITSTGLMFTFDAYQVAAYAAGPQQVLVPYAHLQALIDPDGPIGDFLP